MASVCVFSQTTSRLPISIEYEGKPAIVISEAQMDSINITYARLRLANADLDALAVQLQISRNALADLQIRYDSNKSALTKALRLAENNETKYNILREASANEIEYLKSLKSPKFKNYLIGFLLGALTGALAISML